MTDRTNNLRLVGNLPEFGTDFCAALLRADTPLVLAPAFDEIMAEGARRQREVDVFWSSMGHPPKLLREVLPLSINMGQYPDVVEKWLPEVRGMKG